MSGDYMVNLLDNMNAPDPRDVKLLQKERLNLIASTDVTEKLFNVAKNEQ